MLGANKRRLMEPQTLQEAEDEGHHVAKSAGAE